MDKTTKEYELEIERLKAENTILNSITYFKLKKFYKIVFFLNLLAFTGFAMLVLLYEVDSTLDDTMPPRVAYIMMIALACFGSIMYIFYKLLWNNKKLKQCTYCKRIKVGNSYWNMPEFFNITYTSCAECSTALIPKIHKRHLDQIEKGEL